MARSTVVGVLVGALLCTSALAEITLPIETILLKLTIRRDRKLLRKDGINERQISAWSRVESWRDTPEAEEVHDAEAEVFRDLASADSAIQSAAESHLADVYSSEFSVTPSQVLLTVVTDDDDEGSDTNGIYIRSSFLGGVVTFPDNGEGVIPSRAYLERVTLSAFQVPGRGEPFLEALDEEEHPELEGLLLVGATEVKKDGYGGDGWDGKGDSAKDDNPSVLHDDGSGGLNIWAVAAVAALGAMFLVIILCTSILYCDWRKRKERREKKRERQMAMAAANGNYNRSVSKKSGKGSSAGGSRAVDLEAVEVTADEFGHPALQIVVPAAASGETEELNISPSTQASNDVNNEVASFNPDPANVPNGHGDIGGSTKSKMSNRFSIKSRRSLPNVLHKSKAANAQLQEAEEVASPSQDYNPQNEYVDAGAAPSVTDYSVGEDTTMLYPTINRGRTMSKDNMSDFDGYSMDGMSAVDGVSQFGGSGNASKMDSGVKSRDMYYTGEVPRDFDSVWDDESKLTIDGQSTIDGSYDTEFKDLLRGGPKNDKDVKDKEAYADMNVSLNKLVENQYEESSHSGSRGGVSGVNLHEFDSESESGSNRGAFTLELLGKGSAKKNATGSVAPSQDDEDSILGDMYRDESTDIILGNDSERGEGKKERVPSSGDSVDSTPSWAAPISNALRNSVGIFRTLSSSEGANKDEEADEAAANVGGNLLSKEAQEERTKNKFVSSLSASDDSSVGSNRSKNSSRSSSSNASAKEKGAAKNATGDKALGLTNSMEEEVDEDPAAMIDNINSMLSECREILDTENGSPERAV